MENETERFPPWVVAVLVAVLLILVTGGAFFYSTQKSNVQRQIEKEFNAIGRLKVDQITDWRQDRLADAAILLKNTYFVKGITNFLSDPNPEDTKALQKFFHSFAVHNIYADVLLTDSEGRVQFSLIGKKNLHSVDQESLPIAFRERKPVVTQLHEEAHTIPHISVVAPIFAGENKDAPPLGALILINDARQFLYPLIKTWPTATQTGETLLVRRAGDHVLFLNNLRYSPDAALKLRIALTQTDAPSVMAVMGRTGVVEGRDYRGVDVLSVILPVPGSSWFLVVKEDKAEVFHGWYLQALLILAFFTAVTAGLVSVGLIVWQRNKKVYFRKLYGTESILRKSVERHSITLKAVGDGVIATDIHGRVELMNPVAEALTGWSQSEAHGRPLEEIFHIINEETREQVKNPVTRVLRGGLVVGLANHTLLIAKNGIERPIADSAAPIRDSENKISGVVMVFRDQTEERRTQRLVQARLSLLEFAAANSSGAFIQKALDETGALVQSPIGFYHFVGQDQKTLTLQQWSSRTLQEFCRTEGKRVHYDIDQAGVWVDCIHQKKPVVHNDYPSLLHRKGLPNGHVQVLRELVVPVIYNEKVVAVLGVGNKPENYNERDIEIVSYLADVTWRIVDNKRTEEMLRESEGRYRDLFDKAPIGIFSTTSQGKVVSVNNSMARILGFSSTREAMDHYADLQKELYIHPEQRNLFLQELHRKGWVENFEYEARTKNGKTVWLRMNARKAGCTDDGTFVIEGFVSDITAQRNIEAQLHQVQKIESIGRLAGGVAHDYNNMLNVILGYSELALERVRPEDPVHDDLKEIHKAAIRSAEVTRQLLAFARKQTISPEIVNVNESIKGMLKMLRRLIGEDIDLEWSPHENLWPVQMDPSQLNQILANLCVNARDAIVDVGKITIETNKVTFDESYCNDHVGFLPGDYVLCAVSDNGCGMGKEELDQVFEPFFTTKRIGEGTGLGLATVYGIVKQNDGFINVYSEPGQGTTIKVYIPRCGGEVSEIGQQEPEETPLGNNETVLVVEDEVATLTLCRAMLEKLGYSVLTAASPMDAVRLAKEIKTKISLLVTDVVMPEINGKDLAKQIRSFSPDIKVLFMSGYTANVIAHHGVLDEGVEFIQKPFSFHQLAVRVQGVINKA